MEETRKLRPEEIRNGTPLGIAGSTALAVGGLIVFGCGVYCVITASLGAAPWDVMVLGIAGRTGLLYGTVNILLGAAVILADLLLGERIGIESILDSIVVGKTVDLLTAVGALKTPGGTGAALLMLAAGYLLQAAGLRLYMPAGLCCGPKDAMQLAVARRLKRFPAPAAGALMQLTFLIAALLLKGPVGICTLLAPVLVGLAQTAVFTLTRFEPREVVHQDVIGSLSVLTGRAKNSEMQRKEKQR